MYGDITQFPFLVFHYTPVYHLVVRALATLGIDPLAAGRGTTAAATIAIAILAGAISSTAMREIVPTNARVIGATLSSLMVFTYHPVQEWAVTMRVDMLAIAFSIAGVYLAILAGQRTIILCAAILMFVLAVYTKQTELSAPMAAMLVAIVVNVRSALKASAFGLLIGGAAFIILELSTGGGFWHHVFEYNIHNRFHRYLIKEVILRQKPDCLGVLAGVMAFAFLWWTEGNCYSRPQFNGWVDSLRQSRRLRALVIVSLWFLLASAQLVSIGKSGAARQLLYRMDVHLDCAHRYGRKPCLGESGDRRQSRAVRWVGGASVVAGLSSACAPRPLSSNRAVDDPNVIADAVHLVNLIRENPKPSLSEDMVLLLRAGRAVPIEPAIFAELTATGVWDQRPFLKLVEDHAFGLIILQDQGVQDQVDARFTSEVAHAIQNSYPLIEHVGYYIVRRALAS